MKPLLLIILDGFGSSENARGNAIRAARMETWDRLWGAYPHTLLQASGLAVGLPEGQMGNSEVGHLNIGAGRVVYQELTRIDRAIADGSLQQNSVLTAAVDKAAGGALHLLGLLSDGGVHSSNAHLYALLRLAAARGAENIHVHAILDGRDTLPRSALPFLAALAAQLRALGRGRLSTLCGRYYAMDRDKRWDRVYKAYQLYTAGEGEEAPDARQAVENSYAAGAGDEFLAPVRLTGGGPADGIMRDGDSVICFNFRADRMREIVAALTQPDFSGFARPAFPRLNLTCLTEYDAGFGLPVAFPPEDLPDTLGRVLAAAGMPQLRLAETEKYAHVTFFFNGGREEPEAGEDRILIPSPRVATYDLQPEMSARAVTDAALAALEKDRYPVVVINFANPDMVGHTGVMAAAVRAVETADECLARLWPAVRARGGAMLVTADHGNAEQMIDPETGEPFTAHTTNPVPFVLVSDTWRGATLRQDGALADIAPTVLEILGMRQPDAMSGRSLIAR